MRSGELKAKKQQPILFVENGCMKSLQGHRTGYHLISLIRLSKLFLLVACVSGLLIMLITGVSMISRRHHPNASWILFNDERDLWRMNPDGSQTVCLTCDLHLGQPTSYTWSPHGTWIAVEIFGGWGNRLYMLRFDGKKWWRAPDDDDAYVNGSARADCTWSPDNQWVTFNSASADNVYRPFLAYMARANGNHLRQLNKGDLSHEKEYYSLPVWSPDGQWIVFNRATESESGLYRMHPDGTGIQLIVSDGGSPLWSPNGQWIAFRSHDQTGGESISRIRPDGTERQLLTSDTGNKYLPLDSWSPDGQWLRFSVARDSGQDIYRIRSDGSDLQRLTNGDAQYLLPAWSPDGKWVVFTSRDGERKYPYKNIYIMHDDGSDFRRLVDDQQAYGGFTWSPDSQWIAFQSGADIYRIRPDGSGEQKLAEGRDPLWSPPLPSHFDGRMIFVVGMILFTGGIIPWSWIEHGLLR